MVALFKELFGKISIHALREEGDFQTQSKSRGIRISIHALREEGDRQSAPGHSRQRYFYPRPPRGGRHFAPSFPHK